MFNIRTIIPLLVVGILVRKYVSKCTGSSNIYFILDNSGNFSDRNFQVQTFKFFRNVKQDMNNSLISVVTYSGNITVELSQTHHRDELQKDFEIVEGTVVAGGGARLGTGLGTEEVFELIKEKGETYAGIIVMVTDSELGKQTEFFKGPVFRHGLSATVLVAVVDEYKLKELRELVSEPNIDHIHSATNLDSLITIANELVDGGCVKVTDVQPKSVCVGSTYDVTLFGTGFANNDNQSNITCHFKDNSTSYKTKPTYVSDIRLTCPAPILQSVDSPVSLQVSLTHHKFISIDVRIVGVSCVKGVSKPVATVFVIFLFLVLITIWWFFLLLPCAQLKRRPPPPRPPKPSTITKWPTVDASFYGGTGIGGIKPVKVHWGDKGATEGGLKLTKIHDANVIVDHGGNNYTLHISNDVSPPKCESTPPLTQKRGLLPQRLVQLLGCAQRAVVCLGRLCLVPYTKVASFRPRKGGRCKLYSTASERKMMYG